MSHESESGMFRFYLTKCEKRAVDISYAMLLHSRLREGFGKFSGQLKVIGKLKSIFV